MDLSGTFIFSAHHFILVVYEACVEFHIDKMYCVINVLILKSLLLM